MRRLIFRVLPIYYSFLSGVFVSVAANLFTGIYGSDTLPAKLNILLLAASLSLLSSLLWIVVAMIADDARNTMSSFIKAGLAPIDAANTVIENYGTRSVAYILGAIFFAVLSLSVLVQQPLNTKKEEAAAQNAIQKPSQLPTENSVAPKPALSVPIK